MKRDGVYFGEAHPFHGDDWQGDAGKEKPLETSSIMSIL
jgi:hypothetical protein